MTILSYPPSIIGFNTANFKTPLFDRSPGGRSALSIALRLAGKHFENGSIVLKRLDGPMVFLT